MDQVIETVYAQCRLQAAQMWGALCHYVVYIAYRNLCIFIILSLLVVFLAVSYLRYVRLAYDCSTISLLCGMAGVEPPIDTWGLVKYISVLVLLVVIGIVALFVIPDLIYTTQHPELQAVKALLDFVD